MIQSYILMWKKIGDFKSRTRRDDFWQAALCNCFIVVLLIMLSYSLGSMAVGVQTVYQAASILPLAAMGVRRLHDIGRSGWLIALNLIPFFGNLAFFYMMMCRTVSGANRYGESPYGNVI